MLIGPLPDRFFLLGGFSATRFWRQFRSGDFNQSCRRWDKIEACGCPKFHFVFQRNDFSAQKPFLGKQIHIKLPQRDSIRFLAVQSGEVSFKIGFSVFCHAKILLWPLNKQDCYGIKMAIEIASQFGCTHKKSELSILSAPCGVYLLKPCLSILS